MCTSKLKSKFTASECSLLYLLEIPLCSHCIHLLIHFLRGDMVIYFFTDAAELFMVCGLRKLIIIFSVLTAVLSTPVVIDINK